jgi:site-specific DNA-methyltransferase (adenine-specific)
MISETFLVDNLIEMRKTPDKFYQLAVVDPPYEIADNPSRHGGTGAGKLKNRILNKSARKFKEWDKKPSDEYFSELMRISKNQIIWGGNYFPLPPTRCYLCWDKVQPWENFSQIELAWTSFNAPSQIFKFDNRTGDKIHPTQKPVALYDWIFSKYAKPGDTILDSHLGSGSSRIAAYKAGLDFTGYEIDPEYFHDSNTRFEEFKIQYDQEIGTQKILKNQYRLF